MSVALSRALVVAAVSTSNESVDKESRQDYTTKTHFMVCSAAAILVIARADA